MVFAEIDRGQCQPFDTGFGDLCVEFIYAACLVTIYFLAVVNVAEHEHGAAALAVFDAFAGHPRRGRRCIFCEIEDRAPDSFRGIGFAPACFKCTSER